MRVKEKPYWYTEEGDIDAEEYCDAHNIRYEPDVGTHMMYIWNEHGKQYIYWPTTGRWRARYSRTGTTYRSKGIEDFHKRFLNKVFKKKEETNETKSNSG